MDSDFRDDPGLDGPDYVSLVIEWDELDDSIQGEIDQETSETSRLRAPRPRWLPGLAGAAGALVALALAAWGIHRLRAA